MWCVLIHALHAGIWNWSCLCVVMLCLWTSSSHRICQHALLTRAWPQVYLGNPNVLMFTCCCLLHWWNIPIMSRKPQLIAQCMCTRHYKLFVCSSVCGKSRICCGSRALDCHHFLTALRGKISLGGVVAKRWCSACFGTSLTHIQSVSLGVANIVTLLLDLLTVKSNYQQILQLFF